MQIGLKKYSGLKNKISIELGEELLDIVLFGSAAKGKTIPTDVDICIITKNELNSSAITKLNSLAAKEIHLSFLSSENFFREFHSLAASIMFEGISMITGENISERYGLKSRAMYVYDLSAMDNNSKVKAVNVLKGRGNGGLVKSLGGEFIANAAFLLPIAKDDEMKEVMETNKVKYKKWKLLMD